MMRSRIFFTFFTILFTNFLNTDSVSNHTTDKLTNIHLKDPLGDSDIWKHPRKIKCSQTCPDDYYCPDEKNKNAICLLEKELRAKSFCQSYKKRGFQVPQAIQAAHGVGNTENFSEDPLAGERWRQPASMPCKTVSQCQNDYICGKYLNKGLCALKNEFRAELFCSQK